MTDITRIEPTHRLPNTPNFEAAAVRKTMPASKAQVDA